MPVSGGSGGIGGTLPLNTIRDSRNRSIASRQRKTDGGEEADLEAIILLMVA
jgi:hypothetical protein